MVKLPQDWRPDPGQMALMPAVSGNAINGLGENEPRPPRVVYWAQDPSTIPHGDAQLWFYRRNDSPEMSAERGRRMEAAAAPLPALAPGAAPEDPAHLSARIKAEARRLGAEAVGIARIAPEWVFEGQTMPWRYAVVMGIAMDHAALDHAPGPEAGLEVMRQYTRGVRIARALAGWMRRQGHDAAAEHGPMTGSLTLLPAAIAAGLGELGKHGSLINRDLGASLRLSAVLCDSELIPDAPDDFGADGFCAHCRLCETHCPPGAILPEKQTVRGVRKWYVDFDRCLPFFNETAGCAICLAVCPFSRPGVGANLVEKLLARRARRGG